MTFLILEVFFLLPVDSKTSMYFRLSYFITVMRGLGLFCVCLESGQEWRCFSVNRVSTADMVSLNIRVWAFGWLQVSSSVDIFLSHKQEILSSPAERLSVSQAVCCVQLLGLSIHDMEPASVWFRVLRFCWIFFPAHTRLITALPPPLILFNQSRLSLLSCRPVADVIAQYPSKFSTLILSLLRVYKSTTFLVGYLDIRSSMSIYYSYDPLEKLRVTEMR
jgi:hypothetical protein